MIISFAITVCNEFIEIQRLLIFLLEHKREQDEIVIQMDLSLDDLNTQPEDKKQVFDGVYQIFWKKIAKIFFYLEKYYF